MRKIHLIGNAHLDPVWLWRWQEGFAEIKATFRSALDRMKEFEDCKFTSACSVYYMWIEKSDKAMFEEIKERVKEGRWNIAGGWFLQPDCNIPCGESFARHALISQRYFKEKFGITAKSGYNVDSFGHNASIPKMLKNSGMENYVFMRPMRHEKDISQSLFRWQSMDGSSVLTYRIPFFYNIDLTRFEVFDQIAEMDEGYDMMAFYGIGNHGGGPTVALLEKMEKELGDEFIYSTPDEYFRAVENEEVPIIQDDLQFHAKGCYSANAGIKKWNRAAENAVLECEKYSVLSEKLMGTPYLGGEIKRAWENILFNQFHDILGGCCIKEAYTDQDFLHKEAMSIASRNINFALGQISWNIDTVGNAGTEPICPEKLGTPAVVFNSLAHSIKAVVRLSNMAGVVKNNRGEAVPIQTVRAPQTDGANKYATAFLAEIPALGYTVYRFFKNGDNDFENSFVCTDSTMENDLIRIEFNTKTGEISRIYDKKNSRRLLDGETSTVLIDETHCDTWAHGISEFKDVAGVFKEGSVKLIESGPVRAVMRSHMKRGGTEIIRDYILTKDSNVISVKTKIDFHEKHKMLKFRLPTTVGNPRVLCQIPFGFIERPCDGSEQVCGSWVAMTDNRGGIAAANDSKHSFDADGNVLSLTVLRGAIYADHFGERDELCEYMDQGLHEFEYSVFPYVSIPDCEKKAQELNNKPFLITETFHRGALGSEFSGISVSEGSITVTAVKKHEDSGALVLRCYETEDRDTDAVIDIFGTKIKASFGHSEVKTFIVDSDKVCEADFMEWSK